MSKVFGYVRVSSVDQNEDRQMIAMRDVGFTLISISEKWFYFSEAFFGTGFNKGDVNNARSNVLNPNNTLFLCDSQKIRGQPDKPTYIILCLFSVL